MFAYFRYMQMHVSIFFKNKIKFLSFFFLTPVTKPVTFHSPTKKKALFYAVFVISQQRDSIWVKNHSTINL